jgi:hypothetical protein
MTTSTRDKGRAIARSSYQVFEVHPLAGLLVSGGNPIALFVLEQCRIRVGVVHHVDVKEATVQSQPLVWNGLGLVTDQMREEMVCLATGAMSLFDVFSPGAGVIAPGRGMRRGASRAGHAHRVATTRDGPVSVTSSLECSVRPHPQRIRGKGDRRLIIKGDTK